MSLDELPPLVRVKQLEDKTKIRFYVKPLDEVVSLGFRNMVKNMTIEELKHPRKVDISWSADHGGGYFRAVVKVVARICG